MKNNDVVIVGAVALGAYLLLTSQSGVALPIRRALGLSTNSGVLPTSYDKVNEVMNGALPSQIGYGWRYFDDGTAIGPDGTYYLNGAKVWSPG